MEKEKNIDLKNALIGCGVIFLYLVASSFSYDFIRIFGINYNSLSRVFKIIYNISYEAGITLLIIYIYKKDFIPNLKKFIKNNATYFKKYIKYWFLALILMSVSNVIITFFTTTDIAQNQQSVLDSFKSAPIYTYILTVMIAPILEELVFRLSFRKIFAHTDFIFILFSGLIFGSMHVLGTATALTDFLFIIPYSIPGFIFAYVYTKSKNICVPMSLHIIHNGIMMTLQIILLLAQ